MDALIRWSVRFEMASKQGAGTLGEDFAAQLFREAGFFVSYTIPGSKCGDLRIARRDTGEEFYVEVKTMRQSVNGYQACLRRDGNKTNCSHADYVLLLAVTDGGSIHPFLIPTENIPSTQKLLKIHSLNPHSGCRWTSYRFEIDDLISLWVLADRFQMFGGSPYTFNWSVSLEHDDQSTLVITVDKLL